MLRTIHFNYYPLFCFEEFETYHTMRLEMYQVNFTNNEVIFLSLRYIMFLLHTILQIFTHNSLAILRYKMRNLGLC